MSEPVVSVYDLVDAIRNTLQFAPGVQEAQANDTLAESVYAPMLQVYPDSGSASAGGATDRKTFGANRLQVEDLIINVDVYARQRSHIGEDMAASTRLADAVRGVLHQQLTPPFFGHEHIRSFRWRWQRVTFEYGDPQLRYAGIQFVLTVQVYQ
jgi:hypothetical protein